MDTSIEIGVFWYLLQPFDRLKWQKKCTISRFTTIYNFKPHMLLIMEFVSTHRINNFCTPQIKVILDIIDTYKSFTKDRHNYSSASWNWSNRRSFQSRRQDIIYNFFMQHNGRFLEVSSEQRKSPVVEPTCNERYSKNQRKLQFSLLRSSWFFSAFDKNSSASFRHQTTSHDKHVPQRLWLLTVLCSIDR